MSKRFNFMVLRNIGMFRNILLMLHTDVTPVVTPLGNTDVTPNKLGTVLCCTSLIRQIFILQDVHHFKGRLFSPELISRKW
jgi:hypothetical protein